MDGNQPFIAYSAIGQGNVRSPRAPERASSQRVSRTEATIMTPHLHERTIVNDEGQVVDDLHAHSPCDVATSSDTADAVRHLMLGVVTSGGTAAGVCFPASLDVAAKTGTAETGHHQLFVDVDDRDGPGRPNDTPKVAVAAVVPAQAGLAVRDRCGGRRTRWLAKVLEQRSGTGWRGLPPVQVGPRHRFLVGSAVA